MNIKQQLESVVTFYSTTRQAGHTTAVLNGAKSTDAIVIVHNRDMGEYVNLMSDKKIRTETLQSMGQRLRGTNRPVVFDNAAIYELADESLKMIEQLESENRKLKSLK